MQFFRRGRNQRSQYRAVNQQCGLKRNRIYQKVQHVQSQMRPKLQHCESVRRRWSQYRRCWRASNFGRRPRRFRNAPHIQALKLTRYICAQLLRYIFIYLRHSYGTLSCLKIACICMPLTAMYNICETNKGTCKLLPSNPKNVAIKFF